MTKTIVSLNKRARFDYHIEDTFEAGIVLRGSEVKSIRKGQSSIAESYACLEEGELYLINSNVPEYFQAHQFNHEPKRPRKLLVHKKELKRLFGLIQRKGATLVPLSLYFNDRGIAKVELGVAFGKNKEDKRETEKKQDWKRQQARLMRARG